MLQLNSITISFSLIHSLVVCALVFLHFLLLLLLLPVKVFPSRWFKFKDVMPLSLSLSLIISLFTWAWNEVQHVLVFPLQLTMVHLTLYLLRSMLPIYLSLVVMYLSYLSYLYATSFHFSGCCLNLKFIVERIRSSVILID